MNDFDPKLTKLLHGLFQDNSLILAVLSNAKLKSEDLPQKMTIKPVIIRHQKHFQVSLQYREKIIHQNYTSEQCYEYLIHQIHNFKQTHLFTDQFDVQLLVSKKGKITLLTKPPSKIKTGQIHNRKKNYLLEEGSPIPFLVELGIFSPSGKVIDKKRDKFRQINRFLELIDDVLSQLKPRKNWHIVDFGCGKAYLTFALYHFLKYQKGLEIDMLGLDLKRDVIEQCQALAAKLGYDSLKFKVGDINEHKPESKVDIMLSLHACNTATDAALEQAIRWQADAILSVPCCQHELYHQISNHFLDPLLKHGILKERFAALATDAARGQLLEIMGYRTQILEFIDLEHTPKNLMIRAIREKSTSPKGALIQKYLEYKQALNIFPSLEKRFEKELLPASNQY